MIHRTKKFFLYYIFIFAFFPLLSQNSVFKKNIILQWDTTQYEFKDQNNQTHPYLNFDGANLVEKTSMYLPEYFTIIPIPASKKISRVYLINEQLTECNDKEKNMLTGLSGEDILNTINTQYTLVYEKKQPLVKLHFFPFLLKNGMYYKLSSFDIQIELENASATPLKSNRIYASESVLKSGTWYKIAVTKSGIHKIDYQFLNSLGLDINSINPNNIRIYGNGGGQLPYHNIVYRPDDLQENHIYVKGSDDGVFNTDDYILFYGMEQVIWQYNSSKNIFEHKINQYSDTTYYYLNFDKGPGKRISNAPIISGFDTTVTTFQDYVYHEQNLMNHLKSGREWYGEEFNVKTSYDFTFPFPNIDFNEKLNVHVSLISRSISQPSSFQISLNGSVVNTTSINSVPGAYEDWYAQSRLVELALNPTSPTIQININYNKANSSSVGWLNYITINGFRSLNMTGNQFFFRNTLQNGFRTKMQLTNTSQAYMIWDITKPLEPKNIAFSTGSSAIDFITLSDTIRQFIAFENTNYLTPSYTGTVANQNLHGISNIDYIIVTHPDFLSAAIELAQFHTEQDGLTSAVVTTDQIYNEFSSGSKDITAIKDFMKMLYDKAGTDINKMPKYLLLFGDGSYDHKGIKSKAGNYVPTYQSLNSLKAADGTYVSDDYVGLLDDHESEQLTDIIDLAIGRFPVRTKQEAQNMVNKVKNYYKTNTQKPWRNMVSFVGDDEDGNLHMSQSNQLTTIVRNKAPEFNIEKIFLDAYEQVSSSGGNRYPEVNKAIDNRMERGGLIMAYTGHGGELGWAHERILGVPEINAWTNKENLPAMITATCEFSRFDDPLRTSAGELVILNPDGGAIGLLTTTRLVYASPNFIISKTFFDNAFNRDLNGTYPRLGDLSRLTKKFGPTVTNTRNFTLLGDPAVRLAYPMYHVVTTMAKDTMKALSKITVSGYVSDVNGNKLTNYNGVLYPLVYDKEQIINSLDNDGIGSFVFKTRKNILFNGKASVKNGDFEFSFVVPKDILQGLDSGRISYYVTDGLIDGNGYYEQFLLGGIDSTAAPDNEGPAIDLYMNNEKFVFGGTTNENPSIYCTLQDENGINTTGNGIGRDIVAILDDDITNKIILNDYYEADLDSYQKGKVIYPLKNLSEGKHTLKFKAWDVHNNSSEAYLEFIVAGDEDLTINHVLNYPNPFTTNTGFYFEHNMPGSMLEVIIQIMTPSGKLIKTIHSKSNSNGFRVGPISWDGRDEFGDLIARGVYIYKLKVIAPTGKTVEKFEKLVLF